VLLEKTVIPETKPTVKKTTPATCYHCGETCDFTITAEGKYFCCDGCLFVYQLLSENGLCNYYELSEKPGIRVRGKFSAERFAYLDNQEIKKKLLRFDEGGQQQVHFYLPAMHCASCIWLLENLHSIEPGILYSATDFQRKEIRIAFNPAVISLRKVVELLAFTGYEPYISLEESESKPEKRINRKKLFRIGVAGFCFGNIMMLSFPEYFSSGNLGQPGMENVFTYVNLLLALPVIFYSADEFFISAWKGLRQRWLNIDAPIALAILVSFGRSLYEILSGTGPGYLDSMSGIVFLMLIGRWFQDKTYDSFSFDRDYKSYFPLGVTLIRNGKEETATISALKKGDTVLVRQHEMIPADAIITKGKGSIDYSFVSGENTPCVRRKGELVYAGGTQLGSALELEVVHQVNQSYITRLWNNDVFTRGKNTEKSFIHPWSRYFTFVLFLVAAITAVYWWMNDPARIWPSVTAALIVACPCSLLLSATFTYGNMLRQFGNNKFYLKNASVIESLAGVNTLVFDKTGTLTRTDGSRVILQGEKLEEKELSMIYSMADQSPHPVSRSIKKELEMHYPVEMLTVTGFKETAGLGTEGIVGGELIRLGSESYVYGRNEAKEENLPGQVHFSINGHRNGAFLISNLYRDGIGTMLKSISNSIRSRHVLTGDDQTEKDNLAKIFGPDAKIFFRQSPQDKLDYISRLKKEDRQARVLMLGDGLNDAGALKQSDVGVAVSENTSRFTPACDAIMDSSGVSKLGNFLAYAKTGKKVITASFAFSILYNIVGLGFAVQGLLSPLIAAILMPASSISIVTFVTLATSVAARRKGLR